MRRISLALLALLVARPAASGHDINLTAMTIDLSAAETRVAVRVHRHKLQFANPERDIANRMRLVLDGNAASPHSVFVEDDPLSGTLLWVGAYRPAAEVIVSTPPFPDMPSDVTVLTASRGGRSLWSQALAPYSYPVTVGERPTRVAQRFLVEGIHHILRGLDHLLFLVALLLPIANAVALLKIVTAFTIAHSITLTLSALGLLIIPSGAVEPLIAFSIAVAAAENLLRPRSSAQSRYALAFTFGLIHGCGFAGSLTELALPSHAMGWALIAFNLGVEAGQLAVLSAIVPLLFVLESKRPAVRAAAVTVGSACLVATGVGWSAQRVMGW